MNPREQAQMNASLGNLQKRGDLFTRQMLQSKLKVSKLKELCKEADSLIVKNRDRTKTKAIGLLNLHTLTPNEAYQRADGLNPTKLADINQKKLVNNLEGRLNKALIRQSETENDNNTLKAKIDKVRRKRGVDNFNRIALSKKLEAVNQRMEDILEASRIAAEQREEAVESKNALIGSNIDEAEAFAAEYNRLAQYIDVQNRMLEESISKAAKAVKFEDDGDKTGIDMRGGISVEEEKMMINEVQEIDASMAEGQRTIRKIENAIANYQASFSDLRRVSCLEKTDDIVDIFMKNEEETFSLFNFIQTLNQDTDFTLEMHARLEEEIMEYANEQKLQESSRQATVSNYKKQVFEAKEERRKMAILALDEQKTVEKIAKKVQTLFYKIQCDQLLEGGVKGGNKGAAVSSESRMAVLSGQGVSESNILHFMGLIEERAVQVIGEYVRKLAMSKEGRRPSLGTNGSSIVSGAPASVTGGVPNIEEFEANDSEDDSEEKPLSLNEMKKRVEERVSVVKERKSRTAGHRGTGKTGKTKKDAKME
jgi:hypothetical protein